MVVVDFERWAEVPGDLPPEVMTVVCGPTHLPFTRLANTRQIINPGSVGMPYGRQGAHWAILSGGAVEMRRTAYELADTTVELGISQGPRKGQTVTLRQVRSSGPVTIRARAWLIAWVRSERGLRLATISARIASTAPSRPFGAPRALPDWAARAALTASSGSDLPWRRRSCRSDRSTSTTRTPAADMWRARPAP